MNQAERDRRNARRRARRKSPTPTERAKKQAYDRQRYPRIRKQKIASSQQWVRANQLRVQDYMHARYEATKEQKKEYDREYRQRNAAAIKTAQALRYRQKREQHPDLLQAKNLESYAGRRDDPQFRAARNCRNRVHYALRCGRADKSAKTFELIGCTPAELVQRLTLQFSPGMTWGDYGLHGWHIEHTLPCAVFDLTDPAEQRRCFHFSNLRPMWGRDNLTKHDRVRIPGGFVSAKTVRERRAEHSMI